MNLYFPSMAIIDSGYYIRQFNLSANSNRVQSVAGEFAATAIKPGMPVSAGSVSGQFYQETLRECTADYFNLRSRAPIQVVLSLPFAESLLLYNTGDLITIGFEAAPTIFVPRHCYWTGQIAAGQFVISVPDKTIIELLVLRQTPVQLKHWIAEKIASGLLPDNESSSNQFSAPGKIKIQPFEKRQVISLIMVALSHQTISEESLVHFLNWILVGSWQKDLARIAVTNISDELLRIYGAAEALILDLDQSFSLAVFAKKLGMNTNIIQTHFKALFGCSVYRFLLLIRMEKAKYLLQHADLSIESVGLAVGYLNPGHFATIFKKITGYSPSELRKAELPNTDSLSK
jgi:AraC-like DNA-binding protein